MGENLSSRVPVVIPLGMAPSGQNGSPPTPSPSLAPFLSALRHYHTSARSEVDCRRNFYQHLSQSDRQRLDCNTPLPYSQKLTLIEEAIADNDAFFQGLYAHCKTLSPEQAEATDQQLDGCENGGHDVPCWIIRQLYREWSAEAAIERTKLHSLIIQDLAKALQGRTNSAYGPDTVQTPQANVLLPGACLGRLAHDILTALPHATIEANDISPAAWATYSYLRTISTACTLPIAPWATDFDNQPAAEDQVARFHIPDIAPWHKLFHCVNYTCGDFSLLYSAAEAKHGAFDAVVTHFFIDGCPDLLQTIRTVHAVLRAGGVWINTGPLVWDRADNGVAGLGAKASEDNVWWQRVGFGYRKNDEQSLASLSWRELVRLVSVCGFAMEKDTVVDDVRGYCQQQTSLMQNVYQCGYWIARKC